MNLAREEAIRNYREHWASLAITGVDKGHKRDYLRRHGFPPILFDCFLCELTKQICDRCPIEWPKTHKNSPEHSPCFHSYYGDWANAADPEERKRLAAIIRDLPEKSIKKKAEAPKSPPKYKHGDKVVPVDKTTLNLYGDPYVSNIKGDIHWEKSKKRGYFFAGPVDERASKVNGCIVYECGYTEDGIGNYYRESDLRPCVEPEKPINHAPENKTKKGVIFSFPGHIPVQTELVFHGPTTIRIFHYDNISFKGIAKCAPDDSFNEALGNVIATERASIKLSKYRIAQATNSSN